MDITQISKASAFLRAEDIPEGGMNAVIKSDLELEHDQYNNRPKYMINLQLSNGTKTRVRVNKTSMNLLGNHPRYDMETTNWIGQAVHVDKQLVDIDGKQYYAIYLFPEGIKKEDKDKELRKAEHIMRGYQEKDNEKEVKPSDIDF